MALSRGDRVRVAIARTLTRNPVALVLRNIDVALGPDDGAVVLAMLRRLARTQRLTAIVSLQSMELARTCADQGLVLAGSTLVRDRGGRELQAVPAAGVLETVVQ